MVVAAIDYIEENLTEPLSVQSICELFPFSSWQFQRIFRALAHDSLGNYLRLRRLTEAAQKLIQEPSRRILDVAVEFQFGSQEAFARAFKSQFGVTPLEIRENPELLRVQKKPVISTELLDHMQTGIDKEPKILSHRTRYFVGMESVIRSPLGKNPDYVDLAPKLWEQFNPRRKEIPERMAGVGYGIAVSENMLDDTMLYLAAVEVSEPKFIPEGMRVLKIEPQMYAQFENINHNKRSHSTIDYIYGMWLSSSEFKRAPGYDYEIFDQRFDPKDPKSISTYCLPIVK